MGVFVFTFLLGNISIFCMVMSACFKDYDFGKTKFVLSVNIIASFVGPIL